MLESLANLLAYEPNQDTFLETGGARLLLEALGEKSAVMQRAAARAISNVSQYHDHIREQVPARPF